MKILITGGAGFIGSCVVRLAIEQGHTVINLDALTYAACLDNVISVSNSPNYKFVKADIRDVFSLEEVFSEHQPEAIIHLAAESHVDRSIDSPSDFIETNINGTYNLVEVARKYWELSRRFENFRFLHVSTDEVFGSLGADGVFTEDTPYAPNSPYSASKAASDHLVRAWGKTYGLPVCITNCSNNYGPYQFPEKLIPVVITKALGEKQIPIYGRGENIRDWLYVEDHANALLSVLKRGVSGRTYNIGGKNEIKNIDLVKMICSILDEIQPRSKPFSELITFVTDRPGHDMRYAIDPNRICGELGWEPSVTIEEGLKKTVQWYLENGDWLENLVNVEGVGKRLGSIK